MEITKEKKMAKKDSWPNERKLFKIGKNRMFKNGGCNGNHKV